MPWLETDPMDQRLRFILDDQSGLYDRTELCARYGISRKTGYKNGHTPASRYQPSSRPFPSRLPPLQYPGHFLIKKVTTCGTFRFGPKLLYVANALAHQHVGLEETDDGIWSLFFNTVLLARFDERDLVLHA